MVIGKRLKVDGLYVVSVEVFGGGKRSNMFLTSLMNAIGICIHHRDAPATWSSTRSRSRQAQLGNMTIRLVLNSIFAVHCDDENDARTRIIIYFLALLPSQLPR